MTTIILIATAITICLTFLVGYLFYQSRERANIASNNNLRIVTTLDWKANFLIVIAVLIILFSFSAPFLFTRKAATESFNFSNTGEIGDTIGGLMNPFITLSGVIITGLAFYIQYRANQQQREMFLQQLDKTEQHFQKQLKNQGDQLKLQQFDSQFYEMLRLHRQNIDEMKISGYDFVEERISDSNRD